MLCRQQQAPLTDAPRLLMQLQTACTQTARTPCCYRQHARTTDSPTVLRLLADSTYTESTHVLVCFVHALALLTHKERTRWLLPYAHACSPRCCRFRQKHTHTLHFVATTALTVEHDTPAPQLLPCIAAVLPCALLLQSGTAVVALHSCRVALCTAVAVVIVVEDWSMAAWL